MATFGEGYNGIPPGPLAAYLGIADRNRQLGALSTQNTLGQVGILAKLQDLIATQGAQQRESDFRAGMTPEMTPEQIGQHALRSGVVKGSDAFKLEESLSARKQIAKDMLNAKTLQQKSVLELQARNATTLEQRLAVDTSWKKLQADHYNQQMAIEQGKFYDTTGTKIDFPPLTFNPPAAGAASPAPMASPQPSQTPASEPIQSSELTGAPATTGADLHTANIANLESELKKTLNLRQREVLIGELAKERALLAPKDLREVAKAGAISAARQQSAPQRSDVALRDDVFYQIINGKPRPGSVPTGRAGEGNAYRAQFADELNKVSNELGMTSSQLASAGAETKAKVVALSQQERDLGALKPYKEMLDINANVAINLGKNIAADKTNSAWVNRPLLWVKNNLSNRPDVAEYLGQMHFVEVEAARVLTNPRLVGQLTDSAIADMKSVVSGYMTVASTEAVLKRMMVDGDNRVNMMDRQRRQTISEIRREPISARENAKTIADRQAPVTTTGGATVSNW